MTREVDWTSDWGLTGLKPADQKTDWILHIPPKRTGRGSFQIGRTSV
jgi:hypothetical protein